jgi:PAS domain S-box-containing protein
MTTAPSHSDRFISHEQDGVVVIDEGGVIRHVNSRTESMCGYASGELVGQNIGTLLPTFQDSPPNRAASGAVHGVARRKDGTEMAIVISRSAFAGECGTLEVAQLQRLSSPAAEPKQASVFEAAPDAIFAVDADGVMRLVNRQAEVLFGYERDELVGQPFDMLVSEQTRGSHTGKGRSTPPTLSRRVGVGLDLAGRNKDGAEFPVGLTRSSLETDEGVFELAAVRDITDRMRADKKRGQREASVKVERDEERASLEGQLQQAQRLESVGRLAGGVAHDFNNLLAGIMNYAALVSKGLQNEMQGRGLEEDEKFLALTEDVGQITHAARRAAALTRQLLIFSRRTVVRTEVLDLNAVVGDMEEMLRRTIGENVDHLETLFAADLPLIKADRGQIDQVVMNLVVNARDAMPGGGRLEIETAKVDVDETYGRLGGIEPGTFARLTVSDTGTGMTAEVLERAFEPFFSTKTDTGGSGLGLATVYGIVREAGGEVSIHSKPGLGTTVRVDLPATTEPSPQNHAAQPDAALARPGETVLIVEDEAIVREPAQRLLAGHGYAVLAAASAAAALAIVAKHPGTIDLLLTDVVMPGRSGRELADDIAALRPATKVLFMSGYSYDVTQGVLEKGVSLIEKPFSPDDLLRRVRQVLDSGER